MRSRRSALTLYEPGDSDMCDVTCLNVSLCLPFMWAITWAQGRVFSSCLSDFKCFLCHYFFLAGSASERRQSSHTSRNQNAAGHTVTPARQRATSPYDRTRLRYGTHGRTARPACFLLLVPAATVAHGPVIREHQGSRGCGGAPGMEASFKGS